MTDDSYENGWQTYTMNKNHIYLLNFRKLLLLSLQRGKGQGEFATPHSALQRRGKRIGRYT